MAEDPSKKAEEAKKKLEEIKEISGAIEEGFRELTSRLTDVVDEIKEGSDQLTSFNNITRDISRSIRGLSKINEDLIKNQIKLNQNKISSKDIDEQINKITASRSVLSSRLESLQKKITEEGTATAEQQDEILKLQNALKEASEEVVGEFKKQREEAEKIEKAQININNALGVSGNLLKGMNGLLNKFGLGALNNVINFKQINQQLQTQANQLTNNGQIVLGFGGKLKIAANAAFLLGKQLLKAITDPTIVIGLLIAGFKKLVELGFKADTQVTNLSKSMAISKDQASALRDRFIEIQNSGESLFETTENLVNAQLELANAFGATQGFTEQQVRDQVYLTKLIGLSADEAAGLQQLAMANGKTAKEVNSSIIKQTASLARQTGIQLDNKKILGEVAKVSGQIRLQYQNNPELIAKAVVQTQKLGISLEQAANSSKKLLDFESSIEDQISAELLTGKELNLERARLLALNGDIAGSMEEMLSQVGSSADFASMNVIQQEALAKAVGMTADELANSLIQQENLSRLGSETKQQIQAQVEELRKQGKVEEANQLMRSLGNEKTALAALKQISAQEKFNAAIEKLQSMLTSIVDGAMGEFLNKLVNFISKTENLKAILATIKGIMFGMAVAFAIMNPLAAGLGLAAAASIYALSNTEPTKLAKGGIVTSRVDNATIGEAGPEAIIPLNSPKASSYLGKTETNINIDALIREQQKSNMLLAQLLNKEGIVKIDSTKSGTAMNIGTYKLQ